MSNRTEHRWSGVRVEVVTTTFVASGTPEGIHDLSRFLENLNNRAISSQIQLRAPSVRPLYRATTQTQLEAPLLVRRDEIVFATFDGPDFSRGVVRTAVDETPVLLLAPPFQIQGVVAVGPGADAAQALRALSGRFFNIRGARVFDADGNALGEGEQIIVNGAAVQMMSPTRACIDAAAPAPVRRLQAEPDEAAPAADERARAA